MWHAEDGQGTGEDAFTRLAFVGDSAVVCQSCRSLPLERTTSVECEELLLNAARKMDEARRDIRAPECSIDDRSEINLSALFEAEMAPAPPAEARAQVPSSSPDPSPDFDQLREGTVAAFLASDYPTAMKLLFAAKGLRPKDRWVEANLTRLRELGFRDDGTKQPAAVIGGN